MFQLHYIHFSDSFLDITPEPAENMGAKSERAVMGEKADDAS